MRGELLNHGSHGKNLTIKTLMKSDCILQNTHRTTFLACRFLLVVDSKRDIIRNSHFTFNFAVLMLNYLKFNE